jgi:hypothetical protein
MVDENRAARHSLKRPVLAKRHRPHIIIVADTGENDVAARRGLARSRRARSAVSADPFGRDSRSSIVDNDVMTRALQMPGHRKTHDAQSEKRNLAQAAAPRVEDGAEDTPK